MAVNVGNPQDLTGRKKAQLEAEVAEQRKEAASRMAMVTLQAEAAKDEIIDISGPDSVQQEGEDGKVVSVAKPKKKMRVNTTLEAVTIGHGTNYNFEIGQTYKVDADVYDYLDELGFVWH